MNADAPVLNWSAPLSCDTAIRHTRSPSRTVCLIAVSQDRGALQYSGSLNRSHAGPASTRDACPRSCPNRPHDSPKPNKSLASMPEARCSAAHRESCSVLSVALRPSSVLKYKARPSGTSAASGDHSSCRTEGGSCTGQRASRAMHEPPQSQQPASLPAAEFQPAAAGDPPSGPAAVTQPPPLQVTGSICIANDRNLRDS